MVESLEEEEKEKHNRLSIIMMMPVTKRGKIGGGIFGEELIDLVLVILSLEYW